MPADRPGSGFVLEPDLPLDGRAWALNVRTADRDEVRRLYGQGLYVYVGRGSCPITRSRIGATPTRWGNPYPVSRYGVSAMRKFLRYALVHPELLERARRELKGKALGCWCVPGACHATFWSAIANGASFYAAARKVLRAVRRHVEIEKAKADEAAETAELFS